MSEKARVPRKDKKIKEFQYKRGLYNPEDEKDFLKWKNKNKK